MTASKEAVDPPSRSVSNVPTSPPETPKRPEERPAEPKPFETPSLPPNPPKPPSPEPPRPSEPPAPLPTGLPVDVPTQPIGASPCGRSGQRVDSTRAGTTSANAFDRSHREAGIASIPTVEK